MRIVMCARPRSSAPLACVVLVSWAVAVSSKSVSRGRELMQPRAAFCGCPLAKAGFACFGPARRPARTRRGSAGEALRPAMLFQGTVSPAGGLWPTARTKGGSSFGRGRASQLEATSVLLHDEPTFFGGRQPVTSRIVQWLLTRSIQSKAKLTSGLQVAVEARSNGAAVRGRLDAIGVQFDQLVFDNLQVTGGARFEVIGIDTLMLGLLPGPLRRLRRLHRPCEVNGCYDLTDADIKGSPAIRHMAENILNAAVAGGRPAGAAGPGKVTVFRVRLRGSKLAVEGEMASSLFQVPFRYHTGLSVSRDGHILFLRDPELFWDLGWDTIGGQVPLPMLLQPLDVDLGDGARIERLRISRGRLSIGGRFVVSPVAPLTVSPVPRRATVAHDLGETLSQIICKLFRMRRA